MRINSILFNILLLLLLATLIYLYLYINYSTYEGFESSGFLDPQTNSSPVLGTTTNIDGSQESTIVTPRLDNTRDGSEPLLYKPHF